MQHAHAANIRNLAEGIAVQVQDLKPRQVAQVRDALCIQDNAVCSQVQLRQRTHAADGTRKPGERIAVDVERAQSRKMIEQGNLRVGQFGQGQIEAGDVIEVALQCGHGAQTPPQRQVLKVEHEASQLAVRVHIAQAGVLPTFPDRFVHRVSGLPFGDAGGREAECFGR
ncbi:hypothetical protein D3C84_631530 [compost metagenome]